MCISPQRHLRQGGTLHEQVVLTWAMRICDLGLNWACIPVTLKSKQCAPESWRFFKRNKQAACGEVLLHSQTWLHLKSRCKLDPLSNINTHTWTFPEIYTYTTHTHTNTQKHTQRYIYINIHIYTYTNTWRHTTHAYTHTLHTHNHCKDT